MRNDGGNAFPNTQGESVEEREGMTLLDYFAAKALPAMISMSNRTDFDGRLEREDFEEVKNPKSSESYWFGQKTPHGTCWIMGDYSRREARKNPSENTPHRMVTTIEERIAREVYRQAAAMVARRNKIRSGVGATTHEVLEPLRVLAKIADAYDDNALDDEARKTWGKNHEHKNTTPPDQIELYSGRGGSRLLTLADCFAAREALRKAGMI